MRRQHPLRFVFSAAMVAITALSCADVYAEDAKDAAASTDSATEAIAKTAAIVLFEDDFSKGADR